MIANMADDNWRDYASCREVDPDLFFPEKFAAAQWAAAKAVCNGCPVKDECLSWALADESGLGRGARYGVLGGLTPRERWLRDVGDLPKSFHAGPSLSPCGTIAAARRHNRRGEPQCPACKTAVAVESANRRARNARKAS